MQKVEVSAERTNGPSCTVEFTVGDNVAELMEQFGEEVIYSHVRRSLVIALQAYVRTQLDKDPVPSAEEIQKLVDDWKPGLRRAAKSPKERALEELARMSPADRAQLLKELRAQAKGEQAAA